MKRKLICFLIIGWLFSHSLHAQSFDLESAYQRDVKIRKTGMLILGTWALGNMMVGGIGRSQITGETAYFHEMNLIWNVVNLGIAGAGYYFTKTGDLPVEGTALLASQTSFQKVLFFNADLDVAYMLGGLYLIEKAKNTTKKPERLRGYGKSVILQGTFLLAFDLILASIHQNKTTQLTEFMSHLTVCSHQIGWVYYF